MPLKSKKTKNPQKKIKDTPAAERYARVIAENFDTKLDLIQEGIKTLDRKFEREIKEVHEKMDQKFDLFGLALKRVREDLTSQIQGVRTELKSEIQGVRTELGSKIEETRSELSEKIDQVGRRVAVIEEDVDTLKLSHSVS